MQQTIIASTKKKASNDEGDNDATVACPAVVQMPITFCKSLTRLHFLNVMGQAIWCGYCEFLALDSSKLKGENLQGAHLIEDSLLWANHGELHFSIGITNIGLNIQV